MSAVGPDLPAGARRTTYAGLAAAEAGPLGTGPTLLLVPGFAGSKEDFSPVLAPIAGAGVGVVAVDLPGQHESPRLDDDADQVPAVLAERVLQVRAELPGPVVLVGHSFGGLVARQAVLRDPAAFAGLVLLATGPAALNGHRAELLQLARPLLLEPDGAAAMADAEAALAAQGTALPPRTPAVQEFVKARYLTAGAGALLVMLDVLLGEPDLVEELAAVDVPFFVLHGAADDGWPNEEQADMAQRLGARYEVVPGAFHSPAVEAPDVTATALVSFAREVTSGG